MEYIKKHWKKIIGMIAVVAILVFAYWYGGRTPDSKGFSMGSDALSTTQTSDLSEQLVDASNDQIYNASNTQLEKQNISEEDLQDSTETDQQDNTDSSEDVATDNKSSEDAIADNKSSEDVATDNKSSEDVATDNKSSEDAIADNKSSEDVTADNKSSEDVAQTSETSGDDGKSENPSGTGERSEGKNETESASGNKTGTASNNKNDSGDAFGNKTGNTSSDQSGDSSENGQTGNKYEPTTQAPVSEPEVYTCTISIYCNTVLNNMDLLDSAKASIIPSNGCILGKTTVEFTPGETVFDVLQRVTRQYGIPLEYSYTAIYGSSYIEGINNLYEFDCGEASGWMYYVNGYFPGYGCSQYVLNDQDVIKWIYTCNLGADVGNPY